MHRVSIVRSVNIATSTLVLPGHSRPTGIFKHPVDHAVHVDAPGPRGIGASGLVGDRVCNLKHHGGDDQAVYAYAREDLDWWQAELGKPLSDGSFGENLTTSGINVSQALVGEQWLVGGGLLLEVSDPRLPCRTFADALHEQGWLKRFTQRAAPGTYLRVLRAGEVRAGDRIVVVERPDHAVSVSVAFRAFTTEPELLGMLAGVAALSAGVREKARRRGVAV